MQAFNLVAEGQGNPDLLIANQPSLSVAPASDRLCQHGIRWATCTVCGAQNDAASEPSATLCEPAADAAPTPEAPDLSPWSLPRRESAKVLKLVGITVPGVLVALGVDPNPAPRKARPKMERRAHFTHAAWHSNPFISPDSPLRSVGIRVPRGSVGSR